MHQTISIARELARNQPQTSLPCPVCGASLKAVNLERHLQQVHAAAAPSVVANAAPLHLSGADRRVLWLTLVPGASWLAMVVGWAALSGQLLTGTLRIGLFAAGLLLLLGLPSLVLLGCVRASLVLNGSTVELRYACGLLRCALELPAALEVGSIWDRRPSAGMAQHDHAATENVRIGSYLRLMHAGRSLTIGCTQGPSLKKRWATSNLRSGPRRRHWDITLDVVSCVALEYHLAARNLLTPRAG